MKQQPNQKRWRDSLLEGEARARMRSCYGGAAQRGTVLVGVIVLLTVIMLLVGTLTQSVVRFHHGSERHQRNLQSMLLAEAGMQRAITQLSVDPHYSGERWTIPPESLDNTLAADVIIRVQPMATSPGSLSIVVESHYPPNPALRVMHRRERVVANHRTGDTP